MNTYYDMSNNISAVVDKHGVVVCIETHHPQTQATDIDRPLANIARITGTDLMLINGKQYQIGNGVVARPTMAWRK